MQLAIFQPDIPQNTGTIMRLCACLGTTMHIIEPCGFVMNDKKMKRAVMDYDSKLTLVKHSDWCKFQQFIEENNNRPILLTTKSSKKYTDFKFCSNDIIIAGQETAGVPNWLHNSIDNKITIPMAKGTRSLNVAISCSIALSEALRQTNKLP